MTAASAKRQFIDVAASEVMPYVEVARATPLTSIVGILCETSCAPRREMFLRLINRFRVGVGATEGQSPAEPLLQRQLTSVVIGVATIIAILDGTEGRVGNKVRSNAIGIEGLLVQVAQSGKVCAFGSHVVEGGHHVTGEQPLNPDIPLIYAGINRFWIDGSEANRGGVDGTGIKREVKAGLESYIVGSHVVIGRTYHIVDQEWKIQCQLILTAGTFKQHIETAITHTHDGFRRELINHS